MRRAPLRSPTSCPRTARSSTRARLKTRRAWRSMAILLAVGRACVACDRRGVSERELSGSAPIPTATVCSRTAPTPMRIPPTLVVSTAGSNWYAGNYHNGNGVVSRDRGVCGDERAVSSNPTTFGKANLQSGVSLDGLLDVGRREYVESRQHLADAVRRPCACARCSRAMCVRRTCPSCLPRRSRRPCPASPIRSTTRRSRSSRTSSATRP